MPGARNQDDALIEAAELDAKPALMRAAHVRANGAGGNFAPIRTRPPEYHASRYLRRFGRSPAERAGSNPASVHLASKHVGEAPTSMAPLSLGSLMSKLRTSAAALRSRNGLPCHIGAGTGANLRQTY